MNQEEYDYFHNVDAFFEEVTSISGKLKPSMSKPQKRY
jgi:hypothetical protein